ncbi:DUF6887 family protein [Oscillatoria acuminata]|uniref:Uncharacterized protein n=1 Tax=Oscillatoria acuminata PCC 6304 TaxID=56110 RepID=K9TKW8_9CYAN|nr:hypothetical protein [Oscillatoria acuminata]AFY82669.1 hypothetical protein Oscil6304_3085 [Oscillatoria acuminata PCC 6304]
MSENLENLTNSELKSYIKAHRNDESACHAALKIMMSRRSENTAKYAYDITDEEMEAIFQEKLQSKS